MCTPQHQALRPTCASDRYRPDVNVNKLTPHLYPTGRGWGGPKWAKSNPPNSAREWGVGFEGEGGGEGGGGWGAKTNPPIWGARVGGWSLGVFFFFWNPQRQEKKKQAELQTILWLDDPRYPLGAEGQSARSEGLLVLSPPECGTVHQCGARNASPPP